MYWCVARKNLHFKVHAPNETGATLRQLVGKVTRNGGRARKSYAGGEDATKLAPGGDLRRRGGAERG